MDDLKKRLTKEIQQDFNVKVLDSLAWGLPIHSIETTFQTVMRTKMDILMKMMLIIIKKATIATAEEISDILLVEPLFIQDLIDKMTRARMIDKRGSFYALTTAGVQQLETEIFAHEPETSSKELLYSPCHLSFIKGDLKRIPFKEKELYRYKKEFEDWDIKSIGEVDLLKALKTMGVESSEGNVQVVVSEIISVSDNQTDFVPCIEYRLFNASEDVLYARVWNTLSERWDETLEVQLNERELKKWREMYL